MVLNPTSNESFNWNYSRPNDPGYSTELIGTVVAIQEVQAMNFGAGGKPTTPKFWDNGNPMMMIRIVLCGPNGGIRSLTFQPASKAAREGKKKSLHLDLFKLAGGKDMKDIINKTIKISTEEGHYGLGNPRPWAVELVNDGPWSPSEPLPDQFLVPVLLANQAVSGGQIQQQASNKSSDEPMTDDIPFF